MKRAAARGRVGTEVSKRLMMTVMVDVVVR
jgi:hypothetical protein